MKLVKLNRAIYGSRWTVYGICDHRGDCEILDVLLELNNPPARRMLALLRDGIPAHGPPRANELKSRKLSNKVHELKEGERRGPELRVTYFYNKGSIVVCGKAFQKRERTPKHVVEQTERLRTQYLDDLENENIKIITVEDYCEEDE